MVVSGIPLSGSGMHRTTLQKEGMMQEQTNREPPALLGVPAMQVVATHMPIGDADGPVQSRHADTAPAPTFPEAKKHDAGNTTPNL
jgi:hypothetical protein